MITAGIDGCYIYNFEVKCKYDPKQAILLDPDGKSMSFKLERITHLAEMDDWVKGLKIDAKENLIYAWNQESVCFYTLLKTQEHAQGALIRKYSDLTIKEDFITDMLFYFDYKVFITATQFGHLFVWKYMDGVKQLAH